MGKVEMAEQKDRVEDKNETSGDKGSSWSRNLGDPTNEAPRVMRVASGESIESRGETMASVLQLHATKYQSISSCDQIRGSRSANQDKSATPRGAAIVEQTHSSQKRMPRGGAAYEREGKLGRQETLSGRRTCASPTSMISQDYGVNEATDQNPADFPLPRFGIR